MARNFKILDYLICLLSLLPTEGVLLGIIDLPGEEVFRAGGGGGVLRLEGTGDLAKDLSGVLLRSLLIGKVRSTGSLLNNGLFGLEVEELVLRSKAGLFLLSNKGLLDLLRDLDRSGRLNKGFRLSSSIIEPSLVLPKYPDCEVFDSALRSNLKPEKPESFNVKDSSLKPLVEPFATLLTCVFNVVE